MNSIRLNGRQINVIYLTSPILLLLYNLNTETLFIPLLPSERLLTMHFHQKKKKEIYIGKCFSAGKG